MFSIPAEKLPDVLKDEKRINVIFAPLRNKTVNPKDWENKISSWKTIIKIYCDAHDVYSFTLSSLNNVFIRNGRPPSCLREVITEMAKDGEIQIMEVFLKKCSESWSGWATDILIKRPLSWSYNKLKNTLFTEIDHDCAYVHLNVVNSKCDTLLSRIPDNFKNKLISLKDLLTILDKKSTDVDSIKLLLHNLTNQHKLNTVILNDKNKKDVLETVLIKFANGEKVHPVSEIDIGIYTLEKNEKVISKNIENLEDEIQKCINEAKIHLSKNHRQMAKTALRKKHELEKRVEKKANALHNIQTLLEQIHETHTDAHVWEAYKNALSAFNTTFKDTGMTEDVIEDTMIRLGDVLEMHNDIQTALARPAVETDDTDLEEELAELIKDDANNPPPDDSGITSDLENQLQKLTLNLPDVPDKSPNVSIKELSTNN
uniref:Charged multivesicular body protein n=1 Tax=Anoplophora glabripennis TaxID=217634 RepID=V5H4X7_ANOGL